MAYITNSDIGDNLGVTVASSSYITALIEAVTDYVERLCGGGVVEKRDFEVANGSTTKYYDGNGQSKLLIDDFRSVSALVVDGETLTENEDFYLYPLNADVKEWIELIQPETLTGQSNPRIVRSHPYIFEKVQKLVSVTGQFGYSTTPPSLIKLVVTQLCSAIVREKIGDATLKEVSGETLGEYSVNYGKITEVANKIGAVEMLAPYIRKSTAYSGRKPMSGVIQAS